MTKKNANRLEELNNAITLHPNSSNIKGMLDAYEKGMTDRAKRYAAFDKFYGDAKELFESYADSTPECKHLGDLYSLCICPGGRHGGLDKRKVEIFYGNRPFDSVTTIDKNLQPTKKLETAHGATLSYQRTDDGQVLCCLYPAASENFRPPEDFIILGVVKNPATLTSESKRHWKKFLAYMQVTCLDGKPSIFQRIRVFYIRNFKECVVNGTVQRRKASEFTGKIVQYAATVGLSGFIILFVTLAKESSDSTQAEKNRQEMLRIYSNIQASTQLIAKNSEAIEAEIQRLDQNTSKNLQLLNDAVSKNTTRSENAISQLELGKKVEDADDQKTVK
ncbi:hypothetical protein EST62_03100 [Chlorobaculum sp. 24CR]|uniref:hypothetical protein n=1 Tax=Chlorobaculum sp. 24CR TaxID=2508878 RepID=UPI00100C20A8|nr:hypothetical protein [Chlorobaculum sp. 24CR]RXK88507.1 hypothetical protein EST62_03100 [Chlorobaculum sp. 24CR]